MPLFGRGERISSFSLRLSPLLERFHSGSNILHCRKGIIGMAKISEDTPEDNSAWDDLAKELSDGRVSVRDCCPGAEKCAGCLHCAPEAFQVYLELVDKDQDLFRADVRHKLTAAYREMGYFGLSQVSKELLGSPSVSENSRE